VLLSPSGAELLFEVFSRRYERGSVLVTSNLPFDEWTSGLCPEVWCRRPRAEPPA
jgi:DNA replication protein DnaC